MVLLVEKQIKKPKLKEFSWKVKRKQIAENKGVEKLIKALYFDFIERLPEFPSDNSKYMIGPRVSEIITKVTNKYVDSVRVVEITINENIYVFNFKQNGISMKDGDYCTLGDLHLIHSDRKIFGIHLHLDCDRYFSNWITGDITAFIDGFWIEEFRDLHEMFCEDRMELCNRNRNEDEIKKTKQLKSDFGID